MHNDPLSYLPLTEATFYILLSLSGGQKHGYAILKDVEGWNGQPQCQHLVGHVAQAPRPRAH